MKAPAPCPQCGTSNRPDAEVCRGCGFKFGDRTAAAAPAGPAPATPGTAPPAPAPGMDETKIAGNLRAILQLLRAKDYEGAIARADEILTAIPDHPKALVVKAEALFRSGRAGEAAAAFDVLVRDDPENGKLWMDRSRILRSLQDWGRALESYDRALALAPDHADGWYERGLVLEALGRVPEAIVSLERALAHRPDHKGAAAKRADLEARRAESAVRETAEKIAEEIAEIESEAAARTASPSSGSLDRELGIDGIVAFPRKAAEPEPAEARPAPAVTPVPLGTWRAPAPGRVFTYVEGLDEALGGGIPEGHVVVVAGPPGTLKSSLCLSIAQYNAAKEGRKTLYLTFEAPADSLRLQARSLGLPGDQARDLVQIVEAKGLKDAFRGADEGAVDAFLARLSEFLRASSPGLVVIDSLEALEAAAGISDRRRAIFRIFEHLRGLGVTALVVAERPDILVAGNILYGRWVEDFLADGVLFLRHHLVSESEVQRRIRIMKMRGTRHETSYLALVVDEGRFRVARALAT